MNQNSSQIKIELDKTIQRLSELTEMRQGIKSKLEAMQEDFIAGRSTLDALQSEQTSLTALEASIKTLEARRQELQTNLNKLSTVEERETLLEKAKSSAFDAEAALNDYLEVLSKFNELVGEYGAKMLDTVFVYHSRREEFQNLFARTGLGRLEELGLAPERFEILTVKYINYPPTEYGEIIQTAQRVVKNKRDRDEQNQRQAARQAENHSS